MNPSSETRAQATGGSTNDTTVYAYAARLLESATCPKGTIVDVGCGKGRFFYYVSKSFGHYIGVDVVKFPGFPSEAEFQQIDMDNGRIPLENDTVSVAVSLETIEHLENPRAFMRELVRVTRRGGLIVVSTPNQLCCHSKLCLLFRNEFTYFQERPGLYPSHITALLEIDLLRMARESEMEEVAIYFSGAGRMPFTNHRWPGILSSNKGWRGRAFSDNIFLVGRKHS